MFYFANVTFANIYRKPTFHSEVDTQVLLWEKLEFLEKISPFLRIRTEDQYEGWIEEHQVAVSSEPKTEWHLVSSLTENLYTQPDVNSQVIRKVGAGTRLPVLEKRGEWYKVILPDEQQAYIAASAFSNLPAFNRKNLISVAERFLGVPYIWGGKTAFGFDCSGLLQLAYKLLGKEIRRDAWMQFEDSKPVSKNPADAQPGDLYFFSEDGQKITHVAIALGNKKFIHARGMVQINSLDESEPDFMADLLKNFVEVRTFF